MTRKRRTPQQPGTDPWEGTPYIPTEQSRLARELGRDVSRMKDGADTWVINTVPDTSTRVDINKAYPRPPQRRPLPEAAPTTQSVGSPELDPVTETLHETLKRGMGKHALDRAILEGRSDNAQHRDVPNHQPRHSKARGDGTLSDIT